MMISMKNEYFRPWLEIEELLPSLLICGSTTEADLIDVTDEPMFT